MTDWKAVAMLLSSDDVDAPSEYWNASPDVFEIRPKEPAGANEGGFLVLVTVNDITVLEAIVDEGSTTFSVGLKYEQLKVAEVGKIREHAGLDVDIELGNVINITLDDSN